MGHRYGGWPWLILLMLVQPLSVQSQSLGFSARALQQLPQQSPREARIFVSPQGVRMEYLRYGVPVVEIYNLEQKRAWLLMPEQQRYLERNMPEHLTSSILRGNHDANPCVSFPLAHCVRLGEELLNGRRAIKWQMTVEQNGQSLHSLHWIELEDNMPLKQIWPDGTVNEMQYLGREQRNQRNTLKWQWVSVSPEGKQQISTLWYDPELTFAIREELPGGYVRELDEIRVAEQPGSLFIVPEGFTQTDLPGGPSEGNRMPATTIRDHLPWRNQQGRE